MQNLLDLNPNLIYNQSSDPTSFPVYQSTLRGPMRLFNTAGPVNCQSHYCVPPLQRYDRGPGQTWQDKFFRRTVSYHNQPIEVWGT